MTKRALLVGIGQYKFLNSTHLPRTSLDGPSNDVQLMQLLLRERGFEPQNLTTLTDAGATRQGIFDAMESLRRDVQQSKRNNQAEDIVVFYYSGHGSELVSKTTWPGRVFQTVVSHDSGRRTPPNPDVPNRDILDVEFDVWIRQLNAATPHVTLIFDCCHSGTITRGVVEEGQRSIRGDQRGLEEVLDQAGEGADRESLVELTQERSGRSAIVLSACGAGELSVERESELFNAHHGVFTAALAQRLREDPAAKAWKEIFDPGHGRRETVFDAVQRSNTRQHPRREGNGPIFEPGEIRPDDFFPAPADGLDRYAIVFGINDYKEEDGVMPLRTAVADAEEVARTLHDQHGYQILTLETHRRRGLTIQRDEGNTRPMIDGDATKTKIRTVLRQAVSKIGPESSLLIYFAGHGLTEGDRDHLGGFKGYLLPHGSAQKDFSESEKKQWLAMDELRDLIFEFKCRHLLLVLDCCYASSMTFSVFRGDDAPARRPIYLSEYKRFLESEAWQVLTSSAYNERAQDVAANPRDPISDQRHSPFADAFLDALTSDRADVGGDSGRGDHLITTSELYQHIDTALKGTGVQTPGLFPLKSASSGQYFFCAPGWEPRPLPDPDINDKANNPWPGPLPYTETDLTTGRLFCGRERATLELLARLLESQDENNARAFVISAPSGFGLTSFVQAGLLGVLRSGDAGRAQLRRWVQRLDLDPLLMTPQELTELRDWLKEERRDKKPEELAEQLAAAKSELLRHSRAHFGTFFTPSEEQQEEARQRRLKVQLIRMESLGFPSSDGGWRNVQKLVQGRFLDQLNSVSGARTEWPWDVYHFDFAAEDSEERLLTQEDELRGATESPALVVVEGYRPREDSHRGFASILARLQTMSHVRLLFALRSDRIDALHSPFDVYPVPKPTHREMRDILQQPSAAKALIVEERLGNQLIQQALDDTLSPLAVLSLCLHEMYEAAAERRKFDPHLDRELNGDDFKRVGGNFGDHIVAPMIRRVVKHISDSEPGDARAMRRIVYRLLPSRAAQVHEFEYGELEAKAFAKLVALRFLVVDHGSVRLLSEKLIRPVKKALKTKLGDDVSKLLLSDLRAVWPATDEWQREKEVRRLLWGRSRRLMALLEHAAQEGNLLNRLERRFLAESEIKRKGEMVLLLADAARRENEHDGSRGLLLAAEAVRLSREAGGENLPRADAVLREILAGTPLSLPLSHEQAQRLFDFVSDLDKPYARCIEPVDSWHEKVYQTEARYYETSGGFMTTAVDPQPSPVSTYPLLYEKALELRRAHQKWILRGHGEIPQKVIFNAGGHWLATQAGSDPGGEVRLWPLGPPQAPSGPAHAPGTPPLLHPPTEPRVLYAPEAGADFFRRSFLAFSDYGSLAAGGGRGEPCRWDLDASQVLPTPSSSPGTTGWSTADGWVAELKDGSLELQNLKSREVPPPLARPAQSEGPWSLVTVDSRGQLVVAIDGSRNAVVWDRRSAADASAKPFTPPQPPYGENPEPFHVLAVDADGQFLAGQGMLPEGQAGPVCLWQTNRLDQPNFLEGPDGTYDDAVVQQLVFTSTRGALAALFITGEVLVWQMDALVAKAPPMKKALPVTAFAWNEGHKNKLALGTRKGTVELYDASRDTCDRMIGDYAASVTTLAWSADARRLASGHLDGTIRVWDLGEPAMSEAEPFTFKSGSTRIRALAFDRDGRRLAALSSEVLATPNHREDVREPRTVRQVDRVTVHQLGSEELMQLGRANAGRDLGQEEWLELFPDDPFPPRSLDDGSAAALHRRYLGLKLDGTKID